MTATDPNVVICPTCHSANTMIGVQGNGLCFDCRQEWNPSEVVGFPSPPREVAAGPSIDEAYYPEPQPEPEPDVDPLAALIGTMCRLEGGQFATFVAFPDDDHAEVELPDGRHELISVNDIDRSYEPPAGVEHVELDVPDDEAPLIADAVMTLSRLIIKAGIASVRGEGEAAEIVFPPSGFLPTEQEAFPIVEQACAIAVAALIRSFGLDVNLILNGVEALDASAAEATITEVDDDNTSST